MNLFAKLCSDKSRLCDSVGLTVAWGLTELFKQRPHGVEFRTEPGPIPGFQPLDGAIIVAEGLARSTICKTGSVGAGGEETAVRIP